MPSLIQYLEEVLSKVNPEKAAEIITAEKERLDEANRVIHLEQIANEMLKHGEKIEGKVIGNLDGGQGLVCATNQRVLAVTMNKENQEIKVRKDSFTYQQIAKVSSSIIPYLLIFLAKFLY
jgi:hypothetical protein